MKKHYLTQPSDPCEQKYTDEEINEINDAYDDYREAMEEDKQLDKDE